MATSSDVAKLAGVSQSTVSYVMSGARSISPETRARVEAAMRELDYHPNAGARALAGRRTNVIGLVVQVSADTDVAGLLPFIETISTYCRERDYDVVLLTGDEGPAGLERLAGRQIVDGMVLMDIRPQDERVSTAQGLNCPVVLIGIPDDTQGLDCVDFDVEHAGRLAAQELISTHHERVIMIGEAPETLRKGFGFVEHFTAAVRDEAVAAGVDFNHYKPEAEGWAGLAKLGEVIGSTESPRTGIVARTPRAIDMTVQTLQGLGLSPGIDLSLVGLCTDETATAFRVPVTNVSPEPMEVSLRAMEKLFKRIDERKGPEGIHLVPARLTRRSTTINFSS